MFLERNIIYILLLLFIYKQLLDMEMWMCENSCIEYILRLFSPSVGRKYSLCTCSSRYMLSDALEVSSAESQIPPHFLYRCTTPGRVTVTDVYDLCSAL